MMEHTGGNSNIHDFVPYETKCKKKRLNSLEDQYNLGLPSIGVYTMAKGSLLLANQQASQEGVS